MERKIVIKLFAFIALVSAIVVSLWYFRGTFDLHAIYTYVDQFGVWAPVIFISIYILATVFFLPGSVLTLAGGLLFGPILGTLYNLTAAVIGSSLAFLIARYVASDWVAEKAKAGGRLKQLLDGVADSGWKFIAVIRMVPLFPFNLSNYALGLTKISFWQYVIASIVFMLPGTSAYTYLGSLGEAAITGEKSELITKIVITIGLFVLLALLPGLLKQFGIWKGQSKTQ